MYSTDYLLHSYAVCHSCVSAVEKLEDVALLGHFSGHDGHLRSAVNEGLQVDAVYRALYIEHSYANEELRIEFLGNVVVLANVLPPNLLLDTRLLVRIDVAQPHAVKPLKRVDLPGRLALLSDSQNSLQYPQVLCHYGFAKLGISAQSARKFCLVV